MKSKPPSEESMAEIDSRLMDVYGEVMRLEFDEDMSDVRKNIFYRLLRYAYAIGRRDGLREARGIDKPQNYK